jgi:hypothetical protein
LGQITGHAAVSLFATEELGHTTMAQTTPGGAGITAVGLIVAAEDVVSAALAIVAKMATSVKNWIFIYKKLFPGIMNYRKRKKEEKRVVEKCYL